MLKVQLWNSDMLLTTAQVEGLHLFIDEHLSRHGQESITQMVERIRSATRLRFPTRHNDAVTLFEALGYKIGHPTTKAGKPQPYKWVVLPRERGVDEPSPQDEPEANEAEMRRARQRVAKMDDGTLAVMIKRMKLAQAGDPALLAGAKAQVQKVRGYPVTDDRLNRGIATLMKVALAEAGRRNLEV